MRVPQHLEGPHFERILQDVPYVENHTMYKHVMYMNMVMNHAHVD